MQQILIGRERGLSLAEIRRWLDDPDIDPRRLLLEQKKQLRDRIEQTEAMVRSIDAALAVLNGNESEITDMSELFDGFDPEKYVDEARERWGDTEAYRESARRTRNYTEVQWQAIKAEQATIYAEANAALQDGKAPTDPEVMAIAERHRMSISRWFYECTSEIHLGLADLYEVDSRFAENIDRYGDGLTPYLAAAIRANAENRS